MIFRWSGHVTHSNFIITRACGRSLEMVRNYYWHLFTYWSINFYCYVCLHFAELTTQYRADWFALDSGDRGRRRDCNHAQSYNSTDSIPFGLKSRHFLLYRTLIECYSLKFIGFHQKSIEKLRLILTTAPTQQVLTTLQVGHESRSTWSLAITLFNVSYLLLKSTISNNFLKSIYKLYGQFE